MDTTATSLTAVKSDPSLDPLAWVRSIRARPEYIGLLRVLVDNADQHGRVDVRLGDLLLDLNMTESPMKRMLAHLANLGFFTRESTLGRNGRQVLTLALDVDPEELTARIQNAPKSWAVYSNRVHTDTLSDDGNGAHTDTLSEENYVRPDTLSEIVEVRIYGRTDTLSEVPADVKGARTDTLSEVNRVRTDTLSAGANGVQTDTLSEEIGPPTTPPATDSESHSSLKAHSGDVSTELRVTPSAPAPVRAREAPNGARTDTLSAADAKPPPRPKKVYKPLTDDQRGTLHQRWDGPLGGSDEVDAQIENALEFYATNPKYTDMFLCCNGSLQREADRRATQRVTYKSNGTVLTDSRRAPVQPVGATRGRYDRFS